MTTLSMCDLHAGKRRVQFSGVVWLGEKNPRIDGVCRMYPHVGWDQIDEPDESPRLRIPFPHTSSSASRCTGIHESVASSYHPLGHIRKPGIYFPSKLPKRPIRELPALHTYCHSHDTKKTYKHISCHSEAASPATLHPANDKSFSR
ncbi:uncharacterized protein ARMOST_06753 [Armillaria ostoyae]|uniref:Uncharacterized protein n=1 Tax=Armillaria ostoyae TaxID=47428 RepID=A0A284R3X3_ARMOS|nr:uncharacterized protein ARMOST_06753 [Armillaria ostoyae]